MCTHSTVLRRQRCWCLVHCCGCCRYRRRRHRFKAITSCLTHTLRSYFLLAVECTVRMSANWYLYPATFARTWTHLSDVLENAQLCRWCRQCHPARVRMCCASRLVAYPTQLFRESKLTFPRSIPYLLSRTVICLCSGVAMFSFIPALGAAISSFAFNLLHVRSTFERFAGEMVSIGFSCGERVNNWQLVCLRE